MELKDRVTKLEDEFKILKSEVQAVLLDLRESYLNRENPFNSQAPPIATQPIIITQPSNQQPSIAKGKEEPDPTTPRINQENGQQKLKELFSEPAPVYTQEPIGNTETAREQVKRAERPDIEPELDRKLVETTRNPDGKVDLATINRMTQWVVEATGRLGRQRIESVLDISEMIGHVTPDLKSILLKLLSSIPDEYSGEVTTRDYLVSLIELDTLLGNDNKSEAALLAILCQENDHR